MTTLQALLDQKAALDKQIETTRRVELSAAITQAKAIIEQYGLSAADLGLKGSKSSARKGGKVAAKFHNPATGDSWSGRGLQPKWLRAALESGRRVEDFAV